MASQVGGWREGGHTAVNGVDDRDRNESREARPAVLYPVHAQTNGAEYRHGVFATVNEVWKNVSGVMVTTNALESTPYGGKSCKKPQQPGTARVALRRIVPTVRVQAEE